MERLPTSSAKPGLRLDSYELLCPIAQGGMAVVWLARALNHPDLRLVVVKMLLPQYAMDEQFQQMFVDEATISSGIAHANVARILATGEAHGIPYLVMEYIDGESIARLTEGVKKAGMRFPSGIALRLIADAAAGLHSAHELRDRQGVLLNVVHRDVSPQNVLVRNVGTAAVIDFGIAKARDRLAEETRAGNLKGKVRYMAPEQALGKAVDRRVDVWALGAMLFEIFAGKGPYEGGSEIAALQRLVKGQKPSDLPANVPEPVRRVVNQALSPNREERLPTAAALERALETAIAALGEPATPQHVAEFSAPFMRDRSAARYQAARDAMAQLDAQSGAPPKALQATASGGYVAVTAEVADDATQVNFQYDPDADDPRTLAFAESPVQYPTFGASPTGDSARPFGFGPPSHGPSVPTYSSQPPPSNIAQSISDVLSSSQGGPTLTGPTGTLPPPGTSPFDLGRPADTQSKAGSPFAAAPFVREAHQQGGYPPQEYAPDTQPMAGAYQGSFGADGGAPMAPPGPPPFGMLPTPPYGTFGAQAPAPPRSTRALKLVVATILIVFCLTVAFVALHVTERL